MTHAQIVLDLGLGDAGKGSVVDYFAHSHHSDLVIRFNGGAQAAHNVVVGDVHHTFRQFGSGTFRKARTLYSRRALFDPIMLLGEAELLESKGITDAFSLFYIEEDCVIATVFQQAMNRVRELSRGDTRHGSCGLGIGETARDHEAYPEASLYVKDLVDAKVTFDKLEAIRKLKLSEALLITQGHHSTKLESELEILENPEYSKAATEAYLNIRTLIRVVSHSEAITMLRAANAPIFEGAQGILLDQEYGFYPHITRSDVTPKYALSMCSEAGVTHEVTGLLRAYAVRHGPGPMPTEDHELTKALRDYHNTFGEWQREFRVGYFDAVLSRYAIDVCGTVDNIMITCTDRLAEMEHVKVAGAYLDAHPDQFRVTSLAAVGKTEMSLRTKELSSRTPLWSDFISPTSRSSLEYQFAYARYVLSQIDRNVRLLGISSGTRSGDKYLA